MADRTGGGAPAGCGASVWRGGSSAPTRLDPQVAMAQQLETVAPTLHAAVRCGGGEGGGGEGRAACVGAAATATPSTRAGTSDAPSAPGRAAAVLPGCGRPPPLSLEPEPCAEYLGSTYSRATYMSPRRGSPHAGGSTFRDFTNFVSSSQFARAYLNGRKKTKQGAIKLPVVCDKNGTVIDCGSVFEWKEGVAPRVVSGELTCKVVTFIKNRNVTENYSLDEPSTVSLFSKHVSSTSQPSDAGTDISHFLRSGECAMQGQRKSMEDETRRILNLNKLLNDDLNYSEVVDDTPLSFFAVYDGHGGREAAKHAANTLHYNITRSRFFPSNVEESIKDGIRQTDEQFRSEAAGRWLQSGTTVVCILVHGRRFYVGNLGDSRAVLCRNRRPVALSRDHKPSFEEERTRIEADGGSAEWDGEDWRVSGLTVSRAIGDFDFQHGTASKRLGLSVEADVTSWDIGNDDLFVILACDGLWDVLDNRAAVQHALKFLEKADDPANVAHQLATHALSKGSTDNVSVIVVRLGNQAVQKTDEEYARQALTLQRQNKYIPMRLRKYLPKK